MINRSRNYNNDWKNCEPLTKQKKMKEQKSMDEYRKHKRYQEELLIEEIKLEMKREYEKERKDNEKKQSSILVNLPKLVISKFEDTHLN